MAKVKRYALIEGGTVTNVVLWDGVLSDPDADEETPVVGWQPPEGTTAVACPAKVGIGWAYADGKWTAPPVEEEA